MLSIGCLVVKIGDIGNRGGLGSGGGGFSY